MSRQTGPMSPGASPQGREIPRVPVIVTLFNPIAARLLGAGLPLGPNALLTVTGRKSGQQRTTGVALVEANGRRWVIGTFGDVNWTRNLRAAGEAVLTRGRMRQRVRSVELTPQEAATFFTEVLLPYARRLPFGRWLVGAVLGAGDIFDDPAAAARSHPVFELHTP
jgi:deazaflavin-dependent oxidoreductase (nitroreductase family)